MIDVRLEDEEGAEVESLHDEHDVLGRLPAAAGWVGFRLLRYLDPYGETVFNRPQAPDVVADLADYAMEAADDDTAPFFAELLRLAQRVADEPHLYLRFSGD